MVIEAVGMTDDALAALRDLYPVVRATDVGVEIEADEVRLYDIEDALRPRGVDIRSTYRKEPSLDDVFLRLTGRQLRE
jgi:ABC-2 type transport system ATP-binding protein